MILLRSALFNAWFFGMTALIGLLAVPVRWLAPARAMPIASLWARTVLAGARVLCGIRVDVTGFERLPPPPALIASQHQSAFDTLIWAALLSRFSYVYKAELERIPLFGPMLPAAGQIAVQRKATVASVRQLLRAAHRARADGRYIVIFPEGTRVAHGETAALRGGFTMLANRTGLAVIPVATDSGRYWGRRSFRKFPGHIRVHIGEPLAASLPPDVLVAKLREAWDASEAGPVDNSVDRTGMPGQGPVRTGSSA